MKIVKKQLNEKLIVEADQNPEDGVVNLDNASNKDIADELVAIADDNNVEVTAADVKQEVAEVDKYADEFQKLFVMSKANKNKFDDLGAELQNALETALRQKRANDQSDYPNILVYGQAGVGKTAIVNQFCKEYNIRVVTIKASTLAAESIRGIPYPVQNKKTGEYMQVQVRDPKWLNLNHPCIIFCDEYNRANPKSSDYLLNLINEHILPTTIEKPDGEIEDEVFYPNILFTVAAMNPRTAAFKKTVEALDSAQMGRFGTVYELKADPIKWGKYMKRKYSEEILSNPNLDPDDRAVYEGQLNLSQALVDGGITFNTQQEIDAIYSAHDKEGKVQGYLSPRTLSMLLAKCDGTKKDFLKRVSMSGLTDGDKAKIKNCLINYVDKPTTGNTVFNNGGQGNRANSSANKAAQDIDDYIANEII